MDIVWLGQGQCQDCALVGGKGANLCHLAADYRIPPAFCLTAAAFDRWAARNRDEAAPFPPELYPPLAAAYECLAGCCGQTEPSVAVRSSALDEDGRIASFAGQHATYLNIAGADAVARAVLRCWASARSPHVLAYRRQQGLPVDGIRMAVLVQQFVPADVAAVVFSANPVTGNRDEVVINASWGLGEAIVSGTVTPDTYVVHKADLTIRLRQPAEKRWMTVPAPGGGTRALHVPHWMCTQPALTADQIMEVARLALGLEATMTWPVDVECAYRGGNLYLLQCRPVTGLGAPYG